MAPLRTAPTAGRETAEKEKERGGEKARALVAHGEKEENGEVLSFVPVRAYAVFSRDLHLG